MNAEEEEKPLSVLMIDDDEEDIYTMRRAFRAVAPDVAFSAMSDNSPLFDDDRLLEIELPDIILLDLNMPVFSGIDTLRRLRTGPFRSIVPVIVLSTSSAEDDARRCYENGANVVFTKAASYEHTKGIAEAIARFWRTPGIRMLTPSST